MEQPLQPAYPATTMATNGACPIARHKEQHMRNVTVISQDKVRAIASKLGLSIKEKSGEFKVFGASIAQSIAIPNTKGGATRIYCVGFSPTIGTVAHPKPPAKTVTVMFNHELPEKELLSAIFKAAKSLVVKPTPAAEPATAPAVEEAPASPAEVPAAS